MEKQALKNNKTLPPIKIDKKWVGDVLKKALEVEKKSSGLSGDSSLG